MIIGRRLATVLAVALATGAAITSTAAASTAVAGVDGLAPLPLGQTVAAQMSSSAPDAYVFSAATAGVLTLVASSESGGVQVYVRLPDGTDLAGPAANVTVYLPQPGDYRIDMFHFGGYTPTGDGQTMGGTEITVDYELAAAWLPMALSAPPGDPDGGPDRALPLGVGEAREVGADAVGDVEDWYAITADAAGTLTVDIEPLSASDYGDLTLELYAGGAAVTPVVVSAQDLDGLRKRESASVAVATGELVVARVVGVYQGYWPRAENYVIRAALSPG